MKNIFTSLKKNIKLEFIKKKRSGIFTLSIILGAIFPLVVFITNLFLYNKETQNGNGIPVNFYFESLKMPSLQAFSQFFFPILIIIGASKIAQIDHKNKGWSLMETQPTTKASIYFSKYFMLLASNCIAITSLLTSVVFFTYLLSVFFDIPSDKIMSIPFGDFFRIGVRLFLISLCITAMQYMLSVLISSFIWPLIIGFIGMSIPLLLKSLNVLANWYPFQQLADIGVYPKGSDLGNWFTFSDGLSLLYTLLFLFIGYSWYCHKTFIKTFFQSRKRSLTIIGVVAILGILIYHTANPKQQVRSNKTIISGITSGPNTVKNVYILDVLVQDTLAKIPVIDNKFRYELLEDLKFDAYYIQFDKYHRQVVFFGKNDSLNIDFKIYGQKKEIKIYGSRLAENAQEKPGRSSSDVKYYLSKNLRLKNDDFYIEHLLREWKEKLAKVNNKRTVDNYIPGDDYLTRQNKIISLEYLDYWNQYKKKVKTLYPKKIIKNSYKLEALENSISLNDASLLSDNTYLNYILKDLIKNDERTDVSDSQKHFEAIDKLNPSLFKERLLFRELKTNMEQATKIKTRDSLMGKYLSSIKKESYQKLLLKELKDQNRLSKGMLASNFVAKNTEGESFSLKDFKGKFLLIDIWGNWCGPCLQIAPQYKKKALAYKNRNIVFTKMNFGDSRATWVISHKKNDTIIKDLRPKDPTFFIDNYKIKKYPTFILIDPEGKLISSDFVRPDSNNFNELLNKYLDEDMRKL